MLLFVGITTADVNNDGTNVLLLLCILSMIRPWRDKNLLLIWSNISSFSDLKDTFSSTALEELR